MSLSWAVKIQDYAMVSVIAFLIWLYAEGANVQLYPAQGMVSVPVQVVPATREMVVLSQSVLRVDLQFRGAQAQLARLPEKLAGGLTIRVDQSVAGEFDLVLSEHLPSVPEIKELHVSAVQVSPPTIKVRMDRLVRHPVALQFQPQEIQMVAGSLQPLPQVTVELPESLVGELGSDPANRVLQVDSLVDLRLLPAGVQQSVQGRVRLPQSLAAAGHTRIEPATVPLVFTIDKKEESFTVAAVPVWVLAPPSELATFHVRLHPDDQVLRDVKVSGPPLLIQQIQKGRIPLVARLRLGSDLASMVGKEVTGAITFDAPSQVTVEAPQAQVRYQVVRPGP